MSSWMEVATIAASEVYQDFLQQVVEGHVLNEREGALSEKECKRIDGGSHIDARVVRLMATSGKGGWSDDIAKRGRFAHNTNVTLLDHLLSVVRGAMLLAALDWHGRNPEMDQQMLARRLRVLAVLGFLHDLDKLLGLERDTQLPLDEVNAALARYGLTAFLGNDTVLSAEQLRYLIERVEASQTLRSPPQILPPREFEALTGYVALADKLDGIWLSSEPDKGGLGGVLLRLQRDQTLHTDILRHWHPLELFDPHHPFLLDELQRWISFFSIRKAGVPPLIEVHQDGRLFLLLPESELERIVESSIRRLCASLPFQLELDVSNRGVPSLYNGQPDHDALSHFIQKQLSDRDLAGLFRIKAELAEPLTPALDDLLGNIGLSPRWPKASGATLTPYPLASELDARATAYLQQAAHLALILNLKLDAAKKAGLPDYKQREEVLLETVGQDRPDWLVTIKDDASRRTLTALWVTALAAEDEDLADAVWGTDSLLQRWLEGDNEQPGFSAFITGRGQQVLSAVDRYLHQLLSGQRITSLEEHGAGRCLFTDEPVAFDDTINNALGLYEVKVSAFSGRDGRPESITSERAHTNVGPVSVAEHKLRARAHARQGGKPEGVPTLISSPSTSGLFGGLGLSGDKAMAAMSIYDLSRQEVRKGTVYRGLEAYQGRYRIARFERMGEKIQDQVRQLRLLLQACRRVGRPIHLFRGLPTLERAFFHYDAMPRVLAALIGGNSLRLEQIPHAIRRLEMAQILLETNGLGYDVLRLYAATVSRFGAICLAWCHLRDGNGDRKTLSALQREYVEQLESNSMSNDDGALIKLGQQAAGIQKRVGATAAKNEEMLVFNLCLEAANAARAVGQDDEQSLIFAIAGELETNLVRKGKAAARKHRDNKSLIDGCIEVAEMFVRDVWNGVLRRRPASQRNRRILGSIYRMAFLQATRIRVEETQEESNV